MEAEPSTLNIQQIVPEHFLHTRGFPVLGATAGKEIDKTPFLDEVYILAFGVGGGRQNNGQKSHETYPLAKDFKCYREIQSRERRQAKLAWEGEPRTGAQLHTLCVGLFLCSTSLS